MKGAAVETVQERKPDRLDRGLELWREHRDEIRKLGAGLWSVPGSGGVYLVDLEARHCNCGDKWFNARPDELCKHAWAAVFAMHVGEE